LAPNPDLARLIPQRFEERVAAKTGAPKFVLLDRDGVINRRIPGGYVTSWQSFEFLPGALEALRLLAENAFETLVISNQAAVGMKLITSDELGLITRQFERAVEKEGGRIRGVFYCTHRKDDDCRCRKPRPGLFLEARRQHHLHFNQAVLIGDSESDGLAANLVGCPFIRIVEGEAPPAHAFKNPPLATVRSLLEAVQLVLASAAANNLKTAANP
jgi:histidinol-phosphate phosphatase family protein